MVWHCMARHGMVWSVWYDVVCMAWHGVVWYGKVWYRVVCHGVLSVCSIWVWYDKVHVGVRPGVVD